MNYKSKPILRPILSACLFQREMNRDKCVVKSDIYKS